MYFENVSIIVGRDDVLLIMIIHKEDLRSLNGHGLV